MEKVSSPIIPPSANPLTAIKPNPEVNFFAMTNYRNQNRRFGIKLDDRRRHMYVVGKSGMGKTTILENMVLNDIYAGHGIGLVDPHGDFAEKIIDFIPANRINDVVYFNPTDLDYPIGFNILESVNPKYRHLVTSGLMGVFKKIWPDVWSARMEYILNNTILALLDFPGTTLLGINRLLSDAEYRRKVVNNLKDPVVKAFWQVEFAGYSDKYKQEAVAPIQNKIGQFLSASVIRNIVAQVSSRINIRDIMDTKKIFIMNLSKGKIGEDNSRLLGGMLVTKIQLSAMERVDIPEPERKDFLLYVDEFQNFATESFANILSEARKYRLDLIMAHQYMRQLDEKVLDAVIGNVGTMVTFRVGSADAEIIAKEFAPTFLEEDFLNLPKHQIYLKLLIDGVASRPFSALTLPPIGSSTASTEKVVRVSRERYAVHREKIEDKIARWSGMTMDEDSENGGEMTSDFSDREKSEPQLAEEITMARPVIHQPQAVFIPKPEQRPMPMQPPREQSQPQQPESRPRLAATSAPVQQSAPRSREQQGEQRQRPRSDERRRDGRSENRPRSDGSNRGGGNGRSRSTGSSQTPKNSTNSSTPRNTSPSSSQNSSQEMFKDLDLMSGQEVLLVDPKQTGISLLSLAQNETPVQSKKKPERQPAN